MPVRAERIIIENVFGIEELAFDPDGVSIVRGRNGSGKTSVIRALHQLFEGGHDPDMLRKGEESGSVLVRLDDGTELEASLTEKGTYYHLRGRDDVTARKLIRQLTDEVSVNPIEILRARPKDRGQILLEAMPMRVDEDEVRDALSPYLSSGYSFDFVPESYYDEDAHALDVLGDKGSGMIGNLSDERQGLYGAKRDKAGTVRDLKESVDEDAQDTDKLRQRGLALDEDISEAEDKLDEELQAVDDWKEKKIQEIRDEAEARKEEHRETYLPKINSLTEERARVKEKLETARRQQQTLETIQEREEELETLKEQYSILTRCIENLRDLKSSYRSDLPEDVYIEDGEIYDADDIPFENWNEERKIRFATMIAEMRMGDLQIIPVDGIEKLVGEQRELFLRWAEESPAQFILTEAVEGQDLTVDHYPDDDPADAGEEEGDDEDQQKEWANPNPEDHSGIGGSNQGSRAPLTEDAEDPDEDDDEGDDEGDVDLDKDPFPF